MISLTDKQIEYTRRATHRWNFKIGAVRSGKSFVDMACIIPERIIDRIGESGLSVIIGVSRDTVERNVLKPMREIYGPRRVGMINTARNTARVFGEEVYCLGAEKVSQVAKIQGASFKYCYGDEVARWNREVFEMIKSRLDKSYSCFDGSCNPEHPTHWLKAFLESDADIYVQHYRLFDNPHLPEEYVSNLCREYAGTVYYDRLIEGRWRRAEGAIYRKYADRPDAFRCEVVEEIDPESPVRQFRKKDILSIAVGIDFGGNQSGHAFAARGYTQDMREVVALMSRRVMAADHHEPIDSATLEGMFLDFVADVTEKYGPVDEVYWDSAETVLGNTIRNAVDRRFPHTIVRPAKKARIGDRIACCIRLMGVGRFWITEDCESLHRALSDAVWNERKDDERLDDGSTDIDSLDAWEYTYERDMRYLIM